MGVPSFYRWLIEKYPKITSKFFHAPTSLSTTYVPGIISSFNNEATNQVFACDNLYIDMNGIVHNCTHVKAQTKEEFEATVRDNLFYALDRIIYAANPQQLIYLALDGVPPRAKAAEQRQRRYKTALTLRKAAANPKPSVIVDTKLYVFDSNEISPGTKFMQFIHDSLEIYLETRLKAGGSWANLQIILSNTKVPGEGEHKIMDFIRSLIAQKDYNENTHHMFYGLDADLVFLGLATATKYFTVLRDNHVYIYCGECGLPEHPTYECNKRELGTVGNLIVVSKMPPQTDPLLLLDLFKSCGEIRRHLVDYTPTRPGVLFIDFADPTAAESALRGGWMINGVSLTVNLPEFDIFSLGRVIAVTHMPPDTTQAHISEWFSQFGKIKKVWAPSKRSFYVEYDNEESSKNAVNFKWPADCNLLVRTANERHARKPISKWADKRRPKKAKPTEEKEEVSKEVDKEDDADSENSGVDTDSTDEEDIAHEHATEALADQAATEVKKELEDERKVWRFELTQLHTLCDYFQHELAGKAPLQFIPDFVLFSAFVGNDFVRPLPNFVIMNGSLDLLFSIYKHMKPDFSLVKDGHIQLNNLVAFLEEMVTFERSVFVRKRLPYIPNSAADGSSNNNNEGDNATNLPAERKPRGSRRYRGGFRNMQYRAKDTSAAETHTPVQPTTQDITTAIPASTPTPPPTDPTTTTPAPTPNLAPAPAPVPPQSAQQRLKPQAQPRPPREVNLAKAYADWRVRHYRGKLQVEITNDEGMRKVCSSYLDSLVWVLRYYFSGTPSWSWFYPYHFAPVSCDLLAYVKELVESGHTTTEFLKFPIAEPIKPLYHLMSILPVESAQSVPAAYQPLMTESTSPIADVYPTTFKVDSNGGRFSSHSVVIIDFVDTSRLLQHLTPLDSTLTDDERKRNSFGTDNVLSKPATIKNAYKIETSILSPKDVHWVTRRSGFMLPKESANPNPNTEPTPPPSENVKMRGLPFNSTVENVAQFFAGFSMAPNGITLGKGADGRPSGEALVQFSSIDEATRAISVKHLQHMGSRYIELIPVPLASAPTPAS